MKNRSLDGIGIFICSPVIGWDFVKVRSWPINCPKITNAIVTLEGFLFTGLLWTPIILLIIRGLGKYYIGLEMSST